MNIKRVLFLCLALYGCSSSNITTVWKNQHAYPGKYNKILVAVILSREDTAVRGEIEKQFQQSLEELGYPTISSYSEFGPAGFTDLGQEDTYIKLCNKGIDAVMTIAMVDKRKDGLPGPRDAFTSPTVYYYDHIWNYKRLQLPAADENSFYTWEVILFDLSTLQPHYIMQTKPFNGTLKQALGNEFWKDMTRKLVKERFLKRHPLPTPGPKAF
jgi:hypothetical protein